MFVVLIFLSSTFSHLGMVQKLQQSLVEHLVASSVGYSASVEKFDAEMESDQQGAADFGTCMIRGPAGLVYACLLDQIMYAGNSYMLLVIAESSSLHHFAAVPKDSAMDLKTMQVIHYVAKGTLAAAFGQLQAEDTVLVMPDQDQQILVGIGSLAAMLKAGSLDIRGFAWRITGRVALAMGLRLVGIVKDRCRSCFDS
jgi:hypothetical protein